MTSSLLFSTTIRTPGFADENASEPKGSDRPLAEIVEQSMRPQLDALFDELLRRGREIQIDGANAFNGRDTFLPGKIAVGLSHLLLNTDRDDPRFARYIEGYRRIARLTVNETNHTWGIYFYLSALNQLKRAGLLDQAIEPDVLDQLRTSLDWRPFVRVPEYSLIDLPTNYYEVAFSIARLRFLLGWEDSSASEVLLKRMIDHYQAFSGQYGFADETEGDGRFDRYSALLVAEICERFIEMEMEPTPQLKAWLRNSVDLVLPCLNPQGEGFQYGRSLGPYGDSAFLEILTAAAYLDILTPEEKEMAYAFHVRSAARFVEFWYDPSMRSINLWEKGRGTDAYRGKFRILGENFSLLHQHYSLSGLWQQMGFADRAPTDQFVKWLDGLPRFNFTWFAKGKYDRGLLSFRDGQRVITLPLISGGPTKHMEVPYYPIPFCANALQASPDQTYPQLLPRFTLADGSELTAAAFIQSIDLERDGSSMQVSYQQSEMNRFGERAPVADARLSVATTYTFDSGFIRRVDRYTPAAPLEGVTVSMEFPTFSSGATVENGVAQFAQGEVKVFEATGFDSVEVSTVDGDPRYRAPTGQMITRVRCESQNVTLDRPFTLSWTIRFR